MIELLVDIGNTRIKWGIISDGQIIQGQSLAQENLTKQALYSLWQELPVCGCVAVSCVSRRKALELVMAVLISVWPKVKIILAHSEAKAFGVYNAYKQPEKLGVDRWLCLIAVRHHYPGFVCIVDCGTAITLDFLAADGHHQGGMISPGLMLMKKSLAQGTGSLQFNTTTYLPEPANFTDAAIYSGTLFAAVGLIEHTLNKQSEKMTLILTGGDAELIAEQLDSKPIIDGLLVLRGLAIVLARHK